MFTARTINGNILGSSDTRAEAIDVATRFLTGPRGAAVPAGFEIVETRVVGYVTLKDGEVVVSEESPFLTLKKDDG